MSTESQQTEDREYDINAFMNDPEGLIEALKQEKRQKSEAAAAERTRRFQLEAKNAITALPAAIADAIAKDRDSVDVLTVHSTSPDPADMQGPGAIIYEWMNAKKIVHRARLEPYGEEVRVADQPQRYRLTLSI